MTDYKLVPIEPTLDMLYEGTDVYGREDCAETDVLGIYKAMLAAAPDVQGEPEPCQECGGDGAGGEHEDDCTIAQPTPDVSALVEALQGLLNIVSDSSGVAGYHLNGNIADWDEFEEVENAEVAISTYRKQGAEE